MPEIRARSVEAPAYRLAAPFDSDTPSEDEIIKAALRILWCRISDAPVMSSPQWVKQYLQLEMAEHTHQEVFAVMYLDSQNRLITFKKMFNGSLNQCSVYPRELVRESLLQGAASVILCHNHPSGTLTPSSNDERLTLTLKAALNLVDVKVLDHIITSNEGTKSMAELGLI